MTLHTLAYVGINATDLDAWQQYATRVLALEVVDRDASALRLRMDDKHHRFCIHLAAAPGLAYLGFDVSHVQELEHLTAQLAALGYPATAGTAPECRQRQVMAMQVFADPSGNRVELCVGHKGGAHYTPPRRMSGFKTGALGLGHAVMMTAAMDAMLAFYGVLGMRVSDYIHIAPLKANACFLHCNERHHTLALLPGPHNALHHLMIEANSLDDVGMANEQAVRSGTPVTMTLGKHTNDQMVSFYMQTPSGFEIEYGWGALTIRDEAAWQVVAYDDISFWGHLGPLRASA